MKFNQRDHQLTSFWMPGGAGLNGVGCACGKWERLMPRAESAHQLVEQGRALHAREHVIPLRQLEALRELVRVCQLSEHPDQMKRPEEAEYQAALAAAVASLCPEGVSHG